MKYKQIIFSRHAIQRMFERGLKKEDVLQVIAKSEKIENYPHDKPFPSCLLLGFIKTTPIHVVLASDMSTQVGYVVTAYVPDPVIWDKGFRKRRKE